MNEVKSKRLHRAIENSYKQLERFRNLNRSLVEEYAGSGFGGQVPNAGDGRTGKPDVMVNLLRRAVDAYTMQLVANRPRVLITAKSPELKFFARKFQVALNNFIAEIGLEATLRRWVLDAFFCIGVVKTHMADAGIIEIEPDWRMDPGMPFASNVSLDNWVYDTNAVRWEEVRWAGDTYRIPFDDLAADYFDQDAIALNKLHPTSKYSDDDRRLENIAKGGETDKDEYVPMIDLADVWVRDEGRIYTYAVEKREHFRLQGVPIAAMDWDHDDSNYQILCFGEIPENVIGSSPASLLQPLSQQINNQLRKQCRRARSSKKIHAYSPLGAEDAKRLQRASDDQWVEVANPMDVNTMDVGGIDGNMQAFTLALLQQFNEEAGNLNAIMGLGRSADTLGQEQLIQASANNRVASMMQKTAAATTKLIRELGKMLWEDQFQVISGELPIEGAEGYAIDATWNPSHREGDLASFQIDIDVHSMPYQAPKERLNNILNYVTNVYLPMAQQFEAQGMSLNLQELHRLVAELSNEPRLNDVVIFTQPVMDEDVAGGTQNPDGGMRPPSPPRRYIHESHSPGLSPQGQAVNDMQAWSGLGAQQEASLSQ